MNWSDGGIGYVGKRGNNYRYLVSVCLEIVWQRECEGQRVKVGLGTDVGATAQVN